ncbi:Lrp/AsnC family transcriptional regulator [Streptomyces nigrescens]|uniref:Lrp/AsnC family transcriptional regulator n=1 Tax=Streptomyces nigrescens TaxID=1920 RepID=UPI00348DD1B2
MKDFATPCTGLDETDLAIANALQIAPRASWTTLGDVLGLSAVTVARRWSHISDSGFAWVTATGSPELWRSLCNAFIDVDCHPDERSRVALALARDPRTKSVMELASGRDLHVNVVTRDLPGLSRFILDRVSRLPGVVNVNCQVTTRIHVAGSDWRLDALSSGQRARLQSVAEERSGAQLGRLSDSDRALLLALAPDGRLPVTELATLTGASHSATRRRLSSLVRSGLVSFRCEIAQHITGWPVTALLWGRAPLVDRELAFVKLAKMPSVRLLTATSGDTNVFLSTWLHSIDQTLDLEKRIAAEVPDFKIFNHAIVLRTVKRQGWILDGLGRKRESAPIDPWYDHEPDLPTTRVCGETG